MNKLLVLFLLFTGICSAQLSSWEYYDSMPKPVAGGEILNDTNSENLYIFGGYSDSLQANVNWIQIFDPSAKSWNLDSMSTARYGLVADNFNNLAYFYGGIWDESNDYSGIERWGVDFTDETIFNFNKNFNRIFSTGHIIGDVFYIIGGNSLPGTSSDTLSYIVEYDLSALNVKNQIESIFINGDLPEQQMSEVYNNDIFIFGGVINGISQNIYKFNIIDHTLEELEIKLLQPRAGGKAIIGTESNQIFIIGGYNEDSQAINTVEVFSIDGDQYEISEGPPLQEARYNFMSGYSNGRLYIFGGFDAEQNVISSIEILSEQVTTASDQTSGTELLKDFSLEQNYPNPFNPVTKIQYKIPQQKTQNSTYVTITVFDILGNKIETLFEGRKTAGKYEINFDAGKYPSGIYYYQLKSEKVLLTKKMLLIK